MKKFILSSLLVIFLSACTPSGLLKVAAGGLGGGDILPDVANGQLGANNSQTIGVAERTTTEFNAGSNSVQTSVTKSTGIVTSSPVESVNQTNYNINPLWIIVVVLWSIFLWQLPSPSEISRKLSRWFKKHKVKHPE